MQSIGHQKGDASFFTSESEMKWPSPTPQTSLTTVLFLQSISSRQDSSGYSHTLPRLVRSSLSPMSRSEILDLEDGYYWDSLVDENGGWSSFLASCADNSSSVLSRFLHFQNGSFLRSATIFGNIAPLVPQSWSSLLRSHSHICLEPD